MSASETPTAPLSIYEVLVAYLDQTAEVAWGKLGLHPDLRTGTIEPNLAEAKVAIDLVAYLAGILEAELDDSDRRRVQSLVRDLRVNYVQQNKES